MGFWSKLLFGVGAYTWLKRDAERQRKAEENEKRKLIMEERLKDIVSRLEVLRNTYPDDDEFVKHMRPLKEALFSIDASVLDGLYLKGYKLIVKGFIDSGV